MNAHNELMSMAREYGWTQEIVEPVMGHDARTLTKDGVEVLMEFTRNGVLQYLSVRTYSLPSLGAPKQLWSKAYGTSHYVGTSATKDKRKVAWAVLRADDPVAVARRESEAKHAAAIGAWYD